MTSWNLRLVDANETSKSILAEFVEKNWEGDSEPVTVLKAVYDNGTEIGGNDGLPKNVDEFDDLIDQIGKEDPNCIIRIGYWNGFPAHTDDVDEYDDYAEEFIYKKGKEVDNYCLPVLEAIERLIEQDPDLGMRMKDNTCSNDDYDKAHKIVDGWFDKFLEDLKEKL
jgi:hypothetical protein